MEGERQGYFKIGIHAYTDLNCRGFTVDKIIIVAQRWHATLEASQARGMGHLFPEEWKFRLLKYGSEIQHRRKYKIKQNIEHLVSTILYYTILYYYNVGTCLTKRNYSVHLRFEVALDTWRLGLSKVGQSG